MKKRLVGAAVGLAMLGGFGLSTAGAAPTTDASGCKAGWAAFGATSDAAQFVDRNGDGIVCAKFVEGEGNGNVANLGGFNRGNAVAVDNFIFPAG